MLEIALYVIASCLRAGLLVRKQNTRQNGKVLSLSLTDLIYKILLEKQVLLIGILGKRNDSVDIFGHKKGGFTVIMLDLISHL